jgi:starch phosphorylase
MDRPLRILTSDVDLPQARICQILSLCSAVCCKASLSSAVRALSDESGSTMDSAVAYFSMEIALEPDIPTYSGGLGVLAGDTLRSAADLAVPMVGLTLISRKGYFRQHLDATGWQTEDPVEWNPTNFLQEMPARASVDIEGRTVQLRAWRYEITGTRDFRVPVFLLDSALPENSSWDRSLTDFLYGGDSRYRLCQEVILGIGGVRMLRALGYENIRRFHMNEGHASLLGLELLEEEAKKHGRERISVDDIEAVRQKCVFTTHTPVPAGHDQFPTDLAVGILGHGHHFTDMKNIFSVDVADRVFGKHNQPAGVEKGTNQRNTLNMTYLALNLSGYVNGVAKKHGEVSRLMFAGYAIDAITNGVHAATWTAASFQQLYDRYIPDWRQDNSSLRYALSIPQKEIWAAHLQEKQKLIGHISRATGAAFDPAVLTIGFARRVTAYKRADLVFADPDRLRAMAAKVGPFQLVYAGKAHPQDLPGKELIKRVFHFQEALKNDVRIAYLENYDMNLAKLLVSGVDLWLNTPQPPLEASGTSGMKAALNGIPSLSVLDGWWIEGHIEGITGWAIRNGSGRDEGRSDQDAASLYDKLESVILPLFYRSPDRFREVMRHTIALNGSFFTTQRMLQQYVLKAYFR